MLDSEFKAKLNKETLFEKAIEFLKSNPFYNKQLDINYASLGIVKNFNELAEIHLKDVDKHDIYLLSLTCKICFQNLCSKNHKIEKYIWFIQFTYSIMLNNPNTKEYHENKLLLINSIVKSSLSEECLNNSKNDISHNLEITDVKGFLMRMLYVFESQTIIALDLILYKILKPYFPLLDKYEKIKEILYYKDFDKEIFSHILQNEEIYSDVLEALEEIFPSIDIQRILPRLMNAFVDCFGEKLSKEVKENITNNYNNFNKIYDFSSRNYPNLFSNNNNSDSDDIEMNYKKRDSYIKYVEENKIDLILTNDEIKKGIDNFMKLDIQDLVLYSICDFPLDKLDDSFGSAGLSDEDI